MLFFLNNNYCCCGRSAFAFRAVGHCFSRKQIPTATRARPYVVALLLGPFGPSLAWGSAFWAGLNFEQCPTLLEAGLRASGVSFFFLFGHFCSKSDECLSSWRLSWFWRNAVLEGSEVVCMLPGTLEIATALGHCSGEVDFRGSQRRQRFLSESPRW